ncbi:ferric iron siderophore receptor, partial [Gluconacetobacter sacchari]
IAHVSSVKVPVPFPSFIPTIWEEFQALTGPKFMLGTMNILHGKGSGRQPVLSGADPDRVAVHAART